MKKRFGMEFKETDKGFTIEFTGDEETIKARKEAIAAWKEFVEKADKAGFPPFRHFQHFHHHRHGCCCDTDETKPASDQE